MLRIWDTFLYEGSKVLFRFALAIFKYNEDKILSLSTSIGIFNHLRAMCQNCTEVHRLVQVRAGSKCLISNMLDLTPPPPSNLYIQIGFYDVRNFSKKWIDGKRASHRLQLKVDIHQWLYNIHDHLCDHKNVICFYLHLHQSEQMALDALRMSSSHKTAYSLPAQEREQATELISFDDVNTAPSDPDVSDSDVEDQV